MPLLDNIIPALLLLYALIFPINFAIGNACIDLAIVVGMVRAFRHRQSLQTSREILILMGGYGFILLLSALRADHLNLGLLQAFHAIYYMLPPFLLAHLFIPAPKRFLYLGVMLLPVLASSLYACWQGFHGALRASGFITYLELAGNLSQLLPVLVLLLGEKTNAKYDLWVRVLSASSLLICTAALILTGTRGAWLAVGLSLLLYLLHYTLSAHKSYRVAALLLVLVVISSAALSFIPVAQKRMSSLTNPTEYSIVTRFAMWNSASRMIADHPVMGVGLSNYADRYQNQYFDPEPWEKASKSHDGLTHKHPHNIFLYLLTETGVVGFSFFLLLIGFVCRHFIHMWRVGSPQTKFFAKMALLLLTSYLAFAMTENLIFGMYSAMQSLWFLLGMLWNPYREKEN